MSGSCGRIRYSLSIIMTLCTAQEKLTVYTFITQLVDFASSSLQTWDGLSNETNLCRAENRNL